MTPVTLLVSAAVIVGAVTLSVLLGYRWFSRPRNVDKRLRERLQSIAIEDKIDRTMTPAQQVRREAMAGYAGWLSKPLRYIRAAGVEVQLVPLILLSLSYILISNALIVLFVPSGLRPVALVILLLAPVLLIRHRHSTREEALAKQLPEALDIMSRSLQAGRPLMFCWREMGEAMEAPLGPVCTDIYFKLQFGGDLDEVLSETSRVIASEDVRFFFSSLSIQAKSGGNLIALLQDQSSLLRERITLRERIRTLSAESRLSAWIMGLMPFIVSALMYLISPKTMSLLWTTPTGLTLLQAGFLMQLLGVFWIWRLVRIDV